MSHSSKSTDDLIQSGLNGGLYPHFSDQQRYPLHYINPPTTLKFPRRAWAPLSHNQFQV